MAVIIIANLKVIWLLDVGLYDFIFTLSYLWLYLCFFSNIHININHFYFCEAIMNIKNALNMINNNVWGGGLIFLLITTGIIYTVKLGFVQFRCLPFLVSSMKTEKNKTNKSIGISQFKTVCLSLGTAMGTGNITGVASAIAIGGPGAVFWMWISAFLGMALVYAENYLSVIFSDKHNLSYTKGSIAYIYNGLGCKKIAVVFSILCIFSALGMGGMVQVNSFSSHLYSCIKINPAVLAVIIFFIIFFVVSGGKNRIGTTAQTLLPFVTVVYTIAAFAVLIRFRYNIIPSFSLILADAFDFTSAVGGVSGFAVSKAVSVGIRRGIFSNEAGLGSSPILHSAAESTSPSLQSMWSMFEVFFDTIVCCTLTALVILSSSENKCIVSISDAFFTVFGPYTNVFLTFSMAVFAFCTLIGWFFCGECAFSFLLKNKRKRIFAFLFSLISSLGAVFTLETVWTLSDIFNGLMAFPNLIALILLINYVKRE